MKSLNLRACRSHNNVRVRCAQIAAEDFLRQCVPVSCMNSADCIFVTDLSSFQSLIPSLVRDTLMPRAYHVDQDLCRISRQG
jgi:hypothetical protein